MNDEALVLDRGKKVFLADKAGMCFGVRRALGFAEGAAELARESGSRIYVAGQLVHNRQVSEWLANLGITEITEGDPDGIVGARDVIILPSHGKRPKIHDMMEKKGCMAIDAVCPFVGQALKKAMEALVDGYFILIYGDAGHEEVAVYREWLGDACKVVGDYAAELEDFPLPQKLALMAQTTANQDEFAGLEAWLRGRGASPLSIDTICSATRERRVAAEKLAAKVGVMLVLGGKNSANTKHLAAYCRAVNARTYHIETKLDIDRSWFRPRESIGITAGASTPEWIIKEVVDMMEEFKDQEMEVTQEEQAQTQDTAPQGEAAQESFPFAVQAAEADSQTEAGGEAASQDEASAPSDEASVQQEEAEPEAFSSQASEDGAAAGDAQAEAAEADSTDDPDQEVERAFSEMEAEMGYLDFHPGDIIKGTVVKISSDEVLVDIGYKSEGIIPAFELAFTKVDPLSVVKIGEEISVEVVKEDRDGNIVLSRKNALFEEKINLLEELFEKGEPITAKVIDVVKGGLLVDVGMRGFVPASHVERGFVKDLNEYLKRELDFKILELNRSTRKVILSRKALLEEEHQKVREAFWAGIEEGQTKKGIVKRITDFGAFVDIGGCDGLLHVTEMGWGKVGRPSDVVSINDEIEVYVLKVDREKEKVSLSLKKLLPNPWDLASEKYQVGSIYTGKVMRGASFGAFIQLEPSLEGLAHISQLARFRVNKVEDVLTEGMEVPVKILDIDLEKRRISLSVKEAIDLPKLVKNEEPEYAERSSNGEYADENAAAMTGEAAEADGEVTVADAIGAKAADALAEAVAAETAEEAE